MLAQSLSTILVAPLLLISLVSIIAIIAVQANTAHLVLTSKDRLPSKYFL